MENLEIYNRVREVPETAKKPITGGRLKGMTDINPMWRIKVLTEQFGVCGIGWYYEVVDKRIDTVEGAKEMIATIQINLYVKIDGEWSKPIMGIGGSMVASMERNGLYVDDECVDGDCEVLTKHGWVKFKDYNGQDEIAQFNKDTDEITFVKPLDMTHKVSSNTYRKGSIIMTYGHRNLVENRRGERNTETAENLCGYTGRSLYDLHCGFYGEPKELTPLQKVGIMLAADGTLFKENPDGTKMWTVAFAKERKINRALELLKEAGIEIQYMHTTKRDNPKWHDFTQIRFTLDDTDYKTYKEFLPLGNYKNLFDELIFWDGSYSDYSHSGYYSFFSTNKESVEYLQTILALSGERATIHVTERPEENYKDAYALHQTVRKRSKIVPIEKYGVETEVYCVSVPSTYFLIRKDNEILITGNCWKKAQTDALSVACKNLGIGADVYWNSDNDKYVDHGKENFNASNSKASTYQRKPSTPKNNASMLTPEPSTIDPEAKEWQDKISEFAKTHSMTTEEICKDYKVGLHTPAERLKEVYEDLTRFESLDDDEEGPFK